MIDKKSILKISSKIFPVDKSLKFRCKPFVDIKIIPNLAQGKLEVRYRSSQDKRETDYYLADGDTINIRHELNVEYDENIKNILPLRIDFRGETYILEATKNNKLLLTK